MSRSYSLKWRLIITNLALLLGFILLTGLALQQATLEYALQAQEEKLRGLTYGLLGATELGHDNKLKVYNRELPDRRLLSPASGSYAAFFDQLGHSIWHSPSLLTPLSAPQPVKVGEWKFQRHNGWFQLQLGVSWLINDQPEQRFDLLIRQESNQFDEAQNQFRQTLWFWLGLFALLLMTLQWLLLFWGIRPLKQLTTELEAIKQGEQSKISDHYPLEIQPLTRGLNTLLQHEQNQQSRYRHALDDLAHSLKTPLAVLNNLSQAHSLLPNQHEQLREQVARMSQIVGYQLRKAATAGRQGLRQSEPLLPPLEQLSRVLGKVYHDKQIRFTLPSDPSLQLAMDKGDLMELLGNLLDNACKHGHQQVEISARQQEENLLMLTIDDDGRGFPQGVQEQLLQRGFRADRRQEGQGIGLAVALEIVQAYDGKLTLSRSPLGGARVQLQLTQ